jgi:hypothetical protein
VFITNCRQPILALKLKEQLRDRRTSKLGIKILETKMAKVLYQTIFGTIVLILGILLLLSGSLEYTTVSI